jgi:hypothetical protein
MESLMDGARLKIGKIYRLTFPGIAARVIEPPANVRVGNYPYLVESLVLRSRWWVNERGEPNNIHTPHLIPAHRESRRPAGPSLQSAQGGAVG